MSSWNCPLCGKAIPDSENFCIACKIHRPVYPKNYCTNPSCEEYEKELSDSQQQICKKCGSLTTVGKEIEKFT